MRSLLQLLFETFRKMYNFKIKQVTRLPTKLNGRIEILLLFYY